MKIFIMLLTAVGIALAFGAKALPAEGAVNAPAASLQGKALVDAHCVACHNDALYVAPARKVANLEGLKKRVSSCADGLKIGWTDAQKDEVSAYLNAEYYKFN